MKTTKPKNSLRNKAKLSYSILNLLIVIVLAGGLSSCEDDYYGRDGKPGDAYLSLTWANEIPEYLDAGTGDIPPTFKWGEYYRATPGYYTMYYEGWVWNGFGRTYYAYDVEYEIWRNYGEPGQPYGIDGRDGANTYLTIECSPNGPFLFSTEKSSEMNGKYEIIENTDDRIEVFQEGEMFSMKIIYRKVDQKK